MPSPSTKPSMGLSGTCSRLSAPKVIFCPLSGYLICPLMRPPFICATRGADFWSTTGVERSFASYKHLRHCGDSTPPCGWGGNLDASGLAKAAGCHPWGGRPSDANMQVCEYRNADSITGINRLGLGVRSEERRGGEEGSAWWAGGAGKRRRTQ